MKYTIALTLMIGITIGLIIPDTNSTAVTKKASDVDYVLSECKKLHPKETCVLVAMPVSTD